MSTSNGRLPTPDWVEKTWKRYFSGAGTFGFVFQIYQLERPNAWAAAKVIINQLDSALREIHITNLLTELWTGPIASNRKATPIVKYYDAGFAEWTEQEIKRVFIQYVPNERVSGEKLNRMTRMQKGDSFGIGSRTASIAIMVMNLSGPKSLFTLLTATAFASTSEFETTMTDVLSQFLLVLDCLQDKLKFVHNDVNLGNVLVLEWPEEKVYKFVGSDQKTYYIRSKYQIQLADFSDARVELAGETMVPSTQKVFRPIGSTATDVWSFTPWADLHMLAFALIGGISFKRWTELDNGSPIFLILQSMLKSQFWSAEGSKQRLREIKSLLPPAKKPDTTSRVNYSLQQAQLISYINNTEPVLTNQFMPSLSGLSYALSLKTTDRDLMGKATKIFGEGKQPDPEDKTDYSLQVDELIATHEKTDQPQLNPKLPSLAVLRHHIVETVSVIGMFALVYNFLVDRIKGDPRTFNEIDFGAVKSASADMLRFYVFSPVSVDQASSTNRVLQEQADVFRRYLSEPPAGLPHFDYTLTFDEACAKTLIPWAALRRTMSLYKTATLNK